MNDTRPPALGRPSTRTTVTLVARREITAKLRDKAFLASLAFMLGVLIVSLTISGVLAARAAGRHAVVATVGPQSTSLASTAGLDTHQVADKAAGVALLSAKGKEKVNAVVEVGSAASTTAGTGGTGTTTGTIDPTSVSLTGLTSVPDGIVKAFSAQPHIALLDPPKSDNGAMIGIGIGFSVVFFFVSITFGMSIAQSVVEEKETRIVEILVAAIPVRALLAGKVLGNCVLALGQVALLVVLALVGTNVVSSSKCGVLAADRVDRLVPRVLPAGLRDPGLSVGGDRGDRDPLGGPRLDHPADAGDPDGAVLRVDVLPEPEHDAAGALLHPVHQSVRHAAPDRDG